MVKVELPSTLCKGYDAPDGTSYDAVEGGGYVEVDRPDHIAEIKAQGELRFINQHAFSRRAAEVTCGGCGFAQLLAFAGRPCPRCGGSFSG